VVKWQQSGVDRPRQSSVQVKERIEVYASSFLLGLHGSWRVNLPLVSYLNLHLLIQLIYLLTYLLTYLVSYLLTYVRTPWSRLLFEKLTSSQLVKKFPTFYGTRMFINTFTSVHHLSLS
jgi:hypothetical protein